MKNLNFINGYTMKMCFPEIIILLLVTSTVYAEDTTTSNQTDEIPAIEFLEFLAQWEDDQGQWQDPIHFIDNSLVSPEQTEGDENE